MSANIELRAGVRRRVERFTYFHVDAKLTDTKRRLRFVSTPRRFYVPVDVVSSQFLFTLSRFIDKFFNKALPEQKERNPPTLS